MVLYGMVLCVMIFYGMVKVLYGLIWCGMVLYGMVLHCILWCCNVLNCIILLQAIFDHFSHVKSLLVVLMSIDILMLGICPSVFHFCFFFRSGHAPFTAVVNNRHRNLTMVWRQWKEGDIKVRHLGQTYENK